MALNKVYAAAADDEDGITLASREDGTVTSSLPAIHKKLAVETASRTSKEPRTHRLRRVVVNQYHQLSWTTRETISVTISLFAVLYVFISVPFRIGFLYNPFDATDEERHRWTWEMSVFTPFDVITDAIGIVEFIHFYRLWKNALTHHEEEANLEKDVKVMRSTSPKRIKSMKVLTRGRTSVGLRQGKAKWTLANIGHTSTVYDNVIDDFLEKQSLMARNWEFALEIFALLPIEAFPFAQRSYNALHAAHFNKLCRVYKLRRCFTRLSKIYSDRLWVQHLSSTGIRSLVQTIGFCAGACHWVACGYMLIGHAECGVSLHKCDPNVETSWVVRDQLFGATVARKYGRTLYWASRTMVLLGYDDVTPVSNAETIFGIFVQLTGALFSSSMLATFLFIFRFRNARYAAYSAHVDNAREYMHSKNIPRTIRHQVIAYFDYAWETHHGLDSEEALRLMPRHLHSKVTATLKASRIKQVSFLAKESLEFVNLLAIALERRVYAPADQIIEPKANAQMFFVIRGSVVTSAFSGSNPKECVTGDFFAEMCLLFPEQFEEKAIARTFCELYILAKTKFDDVLSHLYRGSEAAVIDRMAEALERYNTQQRKTQKLLGNNGERSSLHMAYRRMSDYRSGAEVKMENWNFPDSTFRMVWNILRLLAVVYVAFEVPYYAVFVLMSKEENIFVATSPITLRYVCTLLVEVFFGIDIMFQARYFAYLDPVALLNVSDPNLVFAAYRESEFYLDLLSWLPLGLVLESFPGSSAQSYARIGQLLRLLRLRFLPAMLRDFVNVHSLSSKLHLFISLLLGVTLLLHVVGCVWFEMAWLPGKVQAMRGDTSVLHDLTRSECLRQATLIGNCSWIKFDCYANVGSVFPTDDANSPYGGTFTYIRAVYWAVVTLTAVGYGDIVAFSTPESYFAAVWIFVGGIINFGIVGAMSSTIANVMAARHHHLELLNTVNSIMGRLSISEKLSAEIRRFYNHHFAGRKVAYESQLLSHLPDHLCYQISSLLHANAVQSVSLFDSGSVKFLQQVTGKFRHRTYENGETIFLEGDVCREFVVLLRGSKVNIFFRSRKVPVRALHDGHCYGVYEFLLNRAHASTLIAASTVHASVMTRAQFEVIQRKFDDDLRDMKIEAESFWSEQQARLRRVARNLEKLKLKPHVIQTPTLFYQPDSIVQSKTSAGTAIRDVYATRTTFKNVWNAGITFWNVYNAFFVIFRIGFHLHMHFPSEIDMLVWAADLCGDLCFAVDIYLRLYFFGCTEVAVENIITRKWIDHSYRSSNRFKWDIVASLPLYFPASSGSLVVSMCRLPRLIRCLDLWDYLDEVIVQVQQHFSSRKVSAYLGPVKLLIVLVLVAHFVGCIFLWISEDECDEFASCWMEHDHLLHEYHHAVPVVYAKIFYWAITTLLLVGSREIVPRSIAGTIWTLITCLGCSFAMGYIVGEISELILDLGKETKKYKSRIANFEEFAREHELPETLRERVGYFFRVQFKSTHGHDLDHTVNQLSANLRLQLLLEIYGNSLARLPISHFLSSSQINNMALRLQSELFIPGDNILVEGTLGNRLCTLRKGLAGAFWTKSVSTVAVIMEGALFGEAAFFVPDQRRLVTVRATTTCEVLFISKHDWEELWAPTGDQSDAQVQKYAMHSILDWVSTRLHRYQRRCIHVASKAKRELAVRKEAANAMAAAVEDGKSKSNLSMSTSLRRSSSNVLLLSGLSLLQPALNAAKSFVSPEVQTLEKKAKYLLVKTDECAEKLRPALAAIKARRSTGTGTMIGSSRRSIIPMATMRWTRARSLTQAKVNANTHTNACHNTRGDIPAQTANTASNSTHKILLNQFIVDLNPVNKYLKGILPEDSVRHLETECWRRFKLMAAMQHSVKEFLDVSVLPEHDSYAAQPTKPTATGSHPQNKANSFQGKLTRLHSAANLDSHKKGAELLATQSQKLVDTQKSTATSNLNMLTGKSSTTGKRRHTTYVRNGRPGLIRWTAKADPKEETKATLHRMRRCHSLPAFGSKFFDNVRSEETNRLLTEDVFPVGADLDFEIIQRCQRPQYDSQLRLYHRYRLWKGPDRVEDTPEAPRKVHSRKSSLGSRLHGANALRHVSGRLESPTNNAGNHQLAVQAIRTEVNDRKTQEFIHLVKRMGKIWDAMMLFVAVYHVVITPFKLCFPRELVELEGSILHVWASFEIAIDVLCLLDVAYKLHEVLIAHNTGSAGSKRHRLRHVIATNPGLLVDILAVLPLELLLLSANMRVSLEGEEIGLNWWTTRWILRMNRMLLAWRIEPLSEGILQYLIYEVDLEVSEPLVSFLRALASYLAMAHFLACVWFATSDYGLHRYGTSWLSTSGMLTYIPPVDSTSHRRALSSTATSDNVLEGVSLGRKYLRSLHFSMECITTLFYGDILSMNRFELLVEIAITLWAIYIYGALVGAQGELLDSSVRREASFEQNLAELLLYLEQNGVPKTLKRQIKLYYAHVWHRSRGDGEFAVIKGTSRAIREDVVLATLQEFAVRVEVFRALDEPFLRALLVCLQFVVCSQGEDVVVAGDVDRSMYFVAQGRILVKFGDAEMSRERGEFFGELSLLYGISRLETCVAMTVAELFRLDHEPYERVLVDFPEYRVRNKMAWSTTSTASFDRAVLEKSLQGVKKQGPSEFVPFGQCIATAQTISTKVEANQVEAELPRSYVFLSSMEMIARLHDLDPLQAKELILKSRQGASKCIREQFARAKLNSNEAIEAANTVISIENHREEHHDDMVQHFEPRRLSFVQRNVERRNLKLVDLEEDARPPGVLSPRLDN